MADKNSYLAGLKFDPKLIKTPIARYLLNFRYVFLLIIAIIASGLFSFFNIPRRLNPEVKIPIVSVTTILAGASPQDIESLLTIPIEDEVAGLEGVTKVNSVSQDNLSLVSVEFQSGIDPENAKDSVQSQVATITGFPQDAQTPRVQKLDFENQPIWTFLITTSHDEATLMRFGQNLKERVERLPSVKEVNLNGLEEEEIQILIKPDISRLYNVDPLTIAGAVRASTRAQPAGILNSQNSSFALTIDPTTKSTEELRSSYIKIEKAIVKLGDIATISTRSKPNQTKTYYATESNPSQRAISFSVFKTDSVNINQAAKDIKRETESELSRYPDQFQLLNILNLSDEVDKQFSDLAKSFRDTIFLVIIILLLFLGIRQALIVAFSIPLSFLVAFTVMNISGLTLNFLSLFSLILALGLLVDDAIVVVTAVTAYWKSAKFSPSQTGLLVLRDFFVPIWSTTITAVWAFLPILIASGIIGEFIKSISIVVSTTLIASTAIAILITLPLMMVFLKPQFPRRVRLALWFTLIILILATVTYTTRTSPLLPINIIATVALLTVTLKLKKELIRELERWLNNFINVQKTKKQIASIATHGVVDSSKFAKAYQRLIDKVLSSKSARNKTLIIVIAFAVFSYLLVPLGFVVNEFFPKVDQNTIYISVELPPGTNLPAAEKETQEILGQLRKTENTNYVLAETGRSISTEDFFGPQAATNKILFTLALPDKEERNISSFDIAQNLRSKYSTYQKGKFSVVEQSGGPPAGADLQINLLGDDLNIVDDFANEISAYLKDQPAITNVEKSLKSGSGKIVFIPNKYKLAQYGLTEQTLGIQLRTYASGFTVDSNVKFDDLEKDIVFRSAQAVSSPKNLETLEIRTSLGNLPLGALGEFKLEPSPILITREDQKRTISVSASIAQSKQIALENKKLQQFAKSLNLPPGYTTQTGGVNEENQKSVNSILKAMVIAFILISTTMVIQFASYRKALIVLLLIPLAISGVFIIFGLTGTPLSFPTLIGILALFGIVVYQSMLIVDKISRNQRAGMRLKQAISDAAASRVEPILFGTITTVVGLTPISISDPLWRGLGGAIIAGMLFSGGIMLLFIPVVYYKIFEKEKNK